MHSFRLFVSVVVAMTALSASAEASILGKTSMCNDLLRDCRADCHTNYDSWLDDFFINIKFEACWAECDRLNDICRGRIEPGDVRPISVPN